MESLFAKNKNNQRSTKHDIQRTVERIGVIESGKKKSERGLGRVIKDKKVVMVATIVCIHNGQDKN